MTLLNEKKSPGNYFINFDSNNLPSGAYFYRMQAGSFISKKISFVEMILSRRHYLFI
jgi:hypothetical protein